MATQRVQGTKLLVQERHGVHTGMQPARLSRKTRRSWRSSRPSPWLGVEHAEPQRAPRCDATPCMMAQPLVKEEAMPRSDTDHGSEGMELAM
jgi:hypothetical protein